VLCLRRLLLPRLVGQRLCDEIVGMNTSTEWHPKSFDLMRWRIFSVSGCKSLSPVQLSDLHVLLGNGFLAPQKRRGRGPCSPEISNLQKAPRCGIVAAIVTLHLGGLKC
jgi:hypothetical protein